jgi:Protein of unknown function (DUF3160)
VACGRVPPRAAGTLAPAQSAVTPASAAPSPMAARAVAACAAVRGLESAERERAALAAPADARVPESASQSRVAHATDACAVADDSIQSLEDTILAESAPSESAPAVASWDRVAAPRYLDRVAARFVLSSAEQVALRANGFVVPERLETESYGHAMQEVFRSELPLFVSADAILSALYAGNDSMVVALEQQRLRPALSLLLAKLACALPAAAADWPPEVSRDVDLYLAVGRELDEPGAGAGDPEAHAIVESLARAEGLLGAPESPPFVLFGRPRVVDASAFEPRGHYANGGLGLEGYFRAASWLSRLELNLVSRSCKSSHPGASPDPSETPREDLDALALAELVERSHGERELRTLESAWSLLAGRREDVPMAELARLRRQAGIASLREPEAAARLRDAIGDGWTRTARTHFAPEGTTDLPAIATMLGPRVGSDAAATRELVNDVVPGRSMLHATDLAYVLGNDRAKAYLADDLKKWPTLAAQLDRAREEVAMAPVGDDLYGAWLAAIRGLAELPAPAVPSFMRTDAWRDLRLDTTIGAFGQLRHNYVLMSAGTYDAYGCAIPDGWVEPVPATLDAIVEYAGRGARAMGVVDPDQTTDAAAYFARLGRVASVLRRIVATEIAGQPLSDAERRFLGSVAEFKPRDAECMDSCAPPTYTGWWFDLFIQRVADATSDPRFLADYYASTQVGAVAYIGARRPHLGVFVVDAGGAPRAMVGPVASAFETVGSTAQRLTDGDVAEIKGGAAPWARAYTVPAPAEPFGRRLRVTRVAPPSAPARGDLDRPTARAPERPLELDLESDRPLGPVTLELLDHHRVVLLGQTRAAGSGHARFRFDDDRVRGAEGLRVRVGGYVLFSPDTLEVNLDREARDIPTRAP